MIYVLFYQGEPVLGTSESPYTGTCALKEFPGIVYDEVKSGNDFKSLNEVEEIALKLGAAWIAYDNGPSTSNRFGIIQPPRVGDYVSYGFNGDYYPCGKVVRITKSWRIYAEDETRSNPVTQIAKFVFNRKGKSSKWLMKGGTWSLVKGTRNERNQSF